MPIPVTQPAVSRQLLREVAVERIRSAIFDGTLAPGEHLSDPELQRWLGVSRTPVREALKDLERVGLVEIFAQRYTRVALPSAEQCTEMLQAVGILVSGVVYLAMPSLTEAHRRELTAAIGHVIEVVNERDAHRHGTEGWAMIDIFLGACPNRTLVQIARDIIDAFGYKLTVIRSDESTDWDRLVRGYPLLLSAVEENDAGRAAAATKIIFRL